MQLDAKTVATKLGRAKRKSDGSWQCSCPCPVHKNGDRNPSLNLKDGERGLVWKCYAGGTQDDVRAAIAARIPEWESTGPAKAPIISAPQPKVEPSPALVALPDEAREYLHSRGLSDATIDAEQIGYDPTHAGIAFPYLIDGQLQHVKVLKWWETKRSARWWQTPGGGKCYYGLDCITDPTQPVYITEGEMDRLSLRQLGLQAVSVPNGAGLSDKNHPEYIANSVAVFSKCQRIVLAVDADEKGQALREALSRIYGKDRCYTVEYPTGCKDANDVLRSFGDEFLMECMQEAQPFPIRSLQTAAQYLPAVLDLYHNGKARGLSTGYESVDQFYTLVPGELEIVTGIPSSGKTNWLDQVCVNTSERWGIKHAVCSFENPMEQHLSILAEKRARKSFVGFGDVRISEQELVEAIEWINQHFVFIRFDDDAAPTIDAVITQARAAKIRFGIKNLIVDPWNYVEQARKSGQSETEYISEALSKLRIFAQNNDVHVYLVAHPPKLQRDKDGELNPPTGYDVAGSAHFYNKADVFTVVHRNPNVNPQEVQIIWRKVRFKTTGQPGQVTMRYDLYSGCYREQ